MRKKKKWFCFLLAAVCFLQLNLFLTQTAAGETQQTEDAGETQYTEDSGETQQAEDAGETQQAEDTGETQKVEIAGETAIVMEASTGIILYEKNIYEQYYPASITKIMTALLALENCSLEETVTFSEDAVYKTEGSGIARDVGEIMTMEQCLYGMMLQSANECAYAIAEQAGGDYGTFIRMMNERAEELGCRNTHFNNPHGLEDPEHYTCVYDMALISKEALKNEKFCTITGTKKYTIPPTNKHNEETYLSNTHKMLNYYRGTEYLYEGCIGGKTGYTTAAKNTLVTFAERNGIVLICVVMNEEKTKQYLDTAALLDYCFADPELADKIAKEAEAADSIYNGQQPESESTAPTQEEEKELPPEDVPSLEHESFMEKRGRTLIIGIVAAILMAGTGLAVLYHCDGFFWIRYRRRYKKHNSWKTIEEWYTTGKKRRKRRNRIRRRRK